MAGIRNLFWGQQQDFSVSPDNSKDSCHAFTCFRSCGSEEYSCLLGVVAQRPVAVVEAEACVWILGPVHELNSSP